MNVKQNKKCLVLLPVLAFLSPNILQAQSAQNGAVEIQEIIVTAQKREQDLQSLGVSISVLDANQLDERNYQSLPEASRAIANVELFEDYPSAGLPTWVIRGVGLQDFNANNTPTASVFIDEIYQTSVVMGGAGLFDVEQLEVMKGPQGGLYGRNTTGGAVLLNTRRARLNENNAYLRMHYGSWQETGIEGAASFSLQDNLAWRLSGRVINRDDAWQESLPGNTTHGEKQLWDLRSWMRFDPTDSLSIEWKLQGGKDNSEIDLGRAVGVYSATGGFCTSMLSGQRNDANCLSWAGLNQLFQAMPNTNQVDTQSSDGSSVLSEPLNEQANDYIGSLLLINKQFDGLQFSSISSFDRFNYGVQLDLDASDGEFAHRFSSSDIEVFSQEFRLLSNTDAPLSWLLGINFSEENFAERRRFLFRDNFLVISSIGLSLGNVDYDQETSSQAIYGNIRYSINDQWTLNSSLRYTSEDKEYRQGNVYVPGPVPFYVFRNLSRDYTLDNHVSGNLVLEWMPDEDLLLYASYADSFKSGGFYGGFPSLPQEIDPYLEETINAYELGFKSDISSTLRVNGAAFYYDYDDVQGFVSRLNTLTSTQINVLSNQGSAEHTGLELEVDWYASEAVNLGLNLGYLDAELTGNNVTTLDIFGNAVPVSGRRPYAPRWSASASFSYQFSIQGNYRSKFGLYYDYRSKFSGSQANLVEEGIYGLEPYGLTHANLDIYSPTENWQLSFWGNNLFNKVYRTRVKSDGLQSYSDLFGQPRSYGVSLQFSW